MTSIGRKNTSNIRPSSTSAPTPSKPAAPQSTPSSTSPKATGHGTVDKVGGSPVSSAVMKAIGTMSGQPSTGSAPSTTTGQAPRSVLQLQIQQALGGQAAQKAGRASGLNVDDKSNPGEATNPAPLIEGGPKDSEQAEPSRVSKDWYGNANLFAVEREVSGSALKMGDVGGTGVNVGGMTGRGQLHALHGSLEGGATLGVDLKAKTLKAEVYGEATAQVVGAVGELSSGDYGNRVINGQTTVTGKAYVGADAWGNASLHIGKDGVSASGGLDLFAGAKASVEIEQCIGVAGHEIGTVGATVKVFAGVGLEASGELSFRDGRLQTSFEVGASLGVGVGLLATVDVDVVGTAKAVAATASAVVNGIVDAAQRVGKKASSAAAAVWKETSSFRW